MKQNKKPKKFWKKLWLLLSPSRKMFFAIFLFIIIVEILGLIGPYTLKIIIDKITVFDSHEFKNILLY